MKKRRLKSWVIKTLSIIDICYICFVGTTIEFIGKSTYNILLTISTIIAMISLYILICYTDYLD